MTSYGVETSKLRAAKENLPPLKLSSFLDPSQPWVLVPNGSLLGFFDWVPERLRVGPWKPMAPVILVAMAGFIIQNRPSKFIYESPATLVSNYPELYSLFWWYNLTAFAFMTYMIVWLMSNRTKGVVVTYTIISWIMNALRHGFNALVPFLYDHHILLQINRILRFPALATASITFSIWNAILLPYIYVLVLDTKEKRFNFTQWNLRSDDMVRANTSQLFKDEDLWGAITYGYIYGLFYNLVLDRIGVHLYPIFSPRSNLVIVTWLGVFGIHYIFYKMWNSIILNHMQYLQMSVLLSIIGLLTASSATIGFFLFKYQASILKSGNDEPNNYSRVKN